MLPYLLRLIWAAVLPAHLLDLIFPLFFRAGAIMCGQFFSLPLSHLQLLPAPPGLDLMLDFVSLSLFVWARFEPLSALLQVSLN